MHVEAQKSLLFKAVFTNSSARVCQFPHPALMIKLARQNNPAIFYSNVSLDLPDGWNTTNLNLIRKMGYRQGLNWQTVLRGFVIKFFFSFFFLPLISIYYLGGAQSKADATLRNDLKLLFLGRDWACKVCRMRLYSAIWQFERRIRKQLFTEVEVASGSIYRAVNRRDEYPPLATDTEVNNCFSIY